MQNYDLNSVYQAFVEDPLKVGELFHGELWCFCKKAVRKYFKTLAKFHYYEDCVGDSVFQAMKSLPNFKGDSSFTTWLTALTNNRCAQAQREDIGRREKQLVLTEKLDVPAPTGISIVNKLTLQELVSKLPYDDQQFLRLKFEGYTNQEMALSLNTTPGYIEVRYNRLVKDLKKLNEIV